MQPFVRNAFLTIALIFSSSVAEAGESRVDLAVQKLSDAAHDGSVEAKVALGKIYDLGILADQDSIRAAALYREAAEAGSAEAQTLLGRMYFGRPGFPRDEAKAFRLFSLAADSGDRHALGLLAECYRLGYGVAKNDAQSDTLRAQAIESGDGYSAYLQSNFDKGRADYLKDIEYYDPTSEEAQKTKAEIARLYKSANELVLLAAERGDRFAQYNLSQYFRRGLNGFPKDDSEALRWLTLSAQGGNFYAQHLLGVLYRKGEGVQADKARGDRWLAIAARNGHPDSAEIMADKSVASVDVSASAVLLGIAVAVVLASAIHESDSSGGTTSATLEEMPDINHPCYLKDLMSDTDRVMNACY